ncbi:amidohydrolase family protein [Mesohalobacter halotolerans]|uniref:Amidohydrolase n=1 Tax=Mesohalobacter halotolerans TaxID=1883405 RepID=A0A4U5TPG7_9FLAO|nr:amidohydrolase family protein [Mesohalobacter halotolerans]TKS55999.1 amidohydrolase [Mesohalobacter halotolerans]
MRNLIYLLFFLFNLSLFAQEYFPDNEGVKQQTDITYVFTNATIVDGYDNMMRSGQLMIKADKIVAVGKNISIPKDAVIIDLEGKYIYPSFVELFSDFGIKDFKRPSSNGQPQYGPSRDGYYWNDHIRPEQNLTNYFDFDEKTAKQLRKAGYGLVNTHVDDGIIRGTSSLIALSESEDITKTLVAEQTAQVFSFDRSNQTRQSYPTSIMGKMALIRQVYNDAEWYQTENAKNKDLSLEAFNQQQDIPQFFHTDDYLDALRADKVGDEFGVQYTIIGSGDEYKRINEVKQTNAQFILPLNFPKAYDVENPYLTQYLSLSDMKEWHHAPYLFKRFEKYQIPFAITANGLKSPDKLLSHLKTAIEKGLSKEKALAALTQKPAEFLKLSDQVGHLKPGAYANFLITSKDIFEDNMTIYQNWVMGQKHELADMNLVDISGEYQLSFNNQTYDLKLKQSKGKYSAELTKDTLKFGTKLNYKDHWFYLTVTDKSSENEFNRLAARIDQPQSDFQGKVFLNNEVTSNFVAKYQDSKENKKDDKSSDKKEDKDEMLPVTYPNMSYGFSEISSEPKPILVKNATVITGESDGTLENTDVLLKDGKINKIGQNLKSSRAKIIDGSGKFLTAGIVDEHSHIAATSVNEAGHNSSAEVTMEDAVNPDDISIYRSLAGGVTSIQLLHGSANPIGGRSAILKLKWGQPADEMIYDNSPKFIKFALGENVKQSNWGSRTRFPQTRMGVEQVFIDYFSRAKAYGEKKNSGEAYRKDAEMEALLEIINSERFISCHSYVQSEINMLMKVAEQFDFRVNTFTHILEGYKVADKMAKHGAGGSTFSDWWAYKYEVNDAIPFNAAIMHNEGVTVAINSDDGEMIRRLNQEAAKSVKYGNISPEEAWKFVTLNPARLLHIDDRVGSIKEGKDADVVLWNAHPLSVYAKPEYTIIEGKIYFSLEKDKELRQHIKKERSQLINMMLRAKNKGLKTQPIKKENKEFLHCDSEIELH